MRPCSRTAPRPDREQREQLAARGSSVVEGEGAAVEGTNDRLRSPQAAAVRSLT